MTTMKNLFTLMTLIKTFISNEDCCDSKEGSHAWNKDLYKYILDSYDSYGSNEDSYDSSNFIEES